MCLPFLTIKAVIKVATIASLRYYYLLTILNQISWNRNLRDNCIQNFHLGRYIVRYTVRNLVLLWRACGAVKREFLMYIRRYTSPNENFEYGYPHSNALLQFRLKLERCKPHKAACCPTKCDVINDIKLLPTVYHRIYCLKFLTLSNQALRYKIKCIRIAPYSGFIQAKLCKFQGLFKDF